MKEPEEEEEEGVEKKIEEEVKAEIATSTINEPEAEDQEEVNPAGKYMLLDRLMKFIRQQEKPLNAVLSGYFAKLITLLLNRRQKSLLPYVLAPESDIVESLLFHVYQKSLSELITKILNIQDDATRLGDENLVKQLKAKQTLILDTLVDKLGPTCNEEDNLNASSILQDALDTKEYYGIICRRNNLNKLLDFAIPSAESANVESQNAAIGVLA